jgi:hypothetical protein
LQFRAQRLRFLQQQTLPAHAQTQAIDLTASDDDESAPASQRRRGKKSKLSHDPSPNHPNPSPNPSSNLAAPTAQRDGQFSRLHCVAKFLHAKLGE